MLCDAPYATVFPACAGVSLWSAGIFNTINSFPRVCGGEPHLEDIFSRSNVFSPRVRG